MENETEHFHDIFPYWSLRKFEIFPTTVVSSLSRTVSCCLNEEVREQNFSLTLILVEISLIIKLNFSRHINFKRLLHRQQLNNYNYSIAMNVISLFYLEITFQNFNLFPLLV